MSEANWVWATTVPNPRGPGYGVDGDQRGWKLHLVDTNALHESTLSGIGPRGDALCGTRAKYGWGLDMFIDDECARCTARAKKLGIALPESL